MRCLSVFYVDHVLQCRANSFQMAQSYKRRDSISMMGSTLLSGHTICCLGLATHHIIRKHCTNIYFQAVGGSCWTRRRRQHGSSQFTESIPFADYCRSSITNWMAVGLEDGISVFHFLQFEANNLKYWIHSSAIRKDAGYKRGGGTVQSTENSYFSITKPFQPRECFCHRLPQSSAADS